MQTNVRKRMLACLLTLALLLGMLPAGAPKASAMYTWLKDRNLVDGSHFTRSSKMAEKLNAIFDGNINVYHDLKCTQPLEAPFGSSAVPNNNVYKYLGPEGGPAICSGTSCWIYANGVYYTLFGESTFSGVAGKNSERLSLSYPRTATYANFVAWGVRPAVGALIRADDHSMIVLGYDDQTLTILDGNGDGKGLISIRIRTWEEVSFSVEYIIQPKADFYSETYPGWEAPAISAAYPASCALEVAEETVQVRSQPGEDSLVLEQAVQGVCYAAVRLVENGEGTLWYEVSTVAGTVGYLPAKAAVWLGDIDDIAAPGVTAPAHHPVGQNYSLTGSVVSESSELNTVSAFVYKETEEGKTAVAGSETPVTGHYYNLSNSPMDKSKIFSKLPKGAYTYEVAATYTRCYVNALGEVVTQTAARTLYTASFQMTDGAVICVHQYSTAVTQEPTCGAGGSQTLTCKLCATGYTELVPATDAHAYAPQVVTDPTCTQDGVRLHNCTGCWAGYFEAIPATGHSYGDWQTVTEVCCVANGTEKQVCATCGFAQSREIAAIGHNYIGRTVEANCSDYEKQLYTCENCGDTYSEYPEEYTQWSEEKPEGIEESYLETKTQYRCSDRETVESWDANLPGGTLLGSSWQEATTESVQYVKSWPAGFATDHSLYAEYNNAPRSTGETETEIVQVQSEKLTGYLYYHWCQGTYTAGPINRGAKATSYGPYTAFHAFYSTTNPATLIAAGDASYIYKNAACCKDSYWFFAVPVHTQTAAVSKNLFTYERWSDWSDWSDELCTASEDRKVETRVLYRYSTRQLGDHVLAKSKVTAEPTCQAEGILTLYCSYCEHTETQSIAIADHRYDNGRCTGCADRDPACPAILRQPASQRVFQGEHAVFSVAAEEKDLTYCWQYSTNGGKTWLNSTSATAGYNTDTLTVVGTAARNGFLYRCKLTNAEGGKVYSDAAELTVEQPTFASQPADETVKLGNRAAFTVEANGDVKSYQWQYQMVEGGPWWNCTQYTKGYNTPVLNVIAAEMREGFLYRCRVTDAAGNKYYSDSARLSVEIPEHYAVLSQPQNAYVMPGKTTTFHIDTQGEGLTYQWEYRKDVSKPSAWFAMTTTTGCKTDTLTIAGISGSTNRDGWAYRCVVTDSDGYIYTTDYAFLQVTAAQIISQPESQTAAAGSQAVFSVEMAGEVVSCQWQYSTNGGIAWYNSSSATQGYNTDTLTVGATAARNGFLYRCKITDSEGNVLITNPARLTVE